MLNKLTLYFPEELSDERIDAYWELLKSYPNDRLSKGFRKLSLERPYKTFPTVAEIIKYIPPISVSHTVVTFEPEISIEEQQYKNLFISFILKGRDLGYPLTFEGFQEFPLNEMYKENYERGRYLLHPQDAISVIKKFPERWAKIGAGKDEK